MEGRKDKTIKGVLIFFLSLCAAFWVPLIAGKAAGSVKGEWIDVLILCAAVPSIVFAAASVVGLSLYLFAKLKRRYRRRKADARIIKQAKAAGVWDKKPIVLGGRALELKAWQDFKIKREPGEKDKELRGRCMKVYEAAAKEVTKAIAAAVAVPPEVLTGERNQGAEYVDSFVEQVAAATALPPDIVRKELENHGVDIQRVRAAYLTKDGKTEKVWERNTQSQEKEGVHNE